MIGGSLLRDISAVMVDAEGADWQQRSSLAAGEQVWECMFDGKRHSQSFLVTVIFDRRAGTIRSLYAAHTADIDRLPRIPPSIRRNVEDFVQGLYQEAGKCA